MHGGQRAGQGDLEDRAIAVGAAIQRGPIQVPVAALNHAAIWLLAFRARETVKARKCAGWRDLENRAEIVAPAAFGSPIEVPVVGLDQRGVWRLAIDLR